MRLHLTFLSSILFFISTNTSAQIKVVIMGSSTAYGVGASSYANSWAGKTEAYYNQNTADGLDTVFYNIAAPAYDTYQEMPSDFIPPAGRPLPDDSFNVTMALSYHPDIVIISLPSNDINYGYSKAEYINNLKLMSSTIFAAGVTGCYITTTQPRNDMDDSHRDSLRVMVDSINRAFGPYAINFWDDLVTQDGLNMLRDEYRAAPSPVHVNDAGHELLFERILNAHIFAFGGPVALQLTGFKAQLQNNIVSLKWHTEQQAANTAFEIQRSADGHFFETIFIQNVVEARQSYDYSATDQTPLTGKSFYRIKILEPTRQSYSSVIEITVPGRTLNISKLYVDHGTSNLIATISVQKSQFVNMNIVNTSGAIVSKQKIFITQPGTIVNIPVGALAAGQYYFKIFTADGTTVTQAFRK